MPLRKQGTTPAFTQNDNGTLLTIYELLNDLPAMYPRESTVNGVTRHSRHCQALFARRDWRCHRCCELELGALPRKGWQTDYFKLKLGQRQRRLFD